MHYDSLKTVGRLASEYFLGLPTTYETGRVYRVVKELYKQNMLSQKQKTGLQHALRESFLQNLGYIVGGKCIPNVASLISTYLIFSSQDNPARAQAGLIALAISEGFRMLHQAVTAFAGMRPRRPLDIFFQRNNLEDKVRKIEEDFTKTVAD